MVARLWLLLDCGYVSVYMVFIEMSKSIKFDIPKFNGKHFAMWKVKIYVILVKDGCAFVLKGGKLSKKG